MLAAPVVFIAGSRGPRERHLHGQRATRGARAHPYGDVHETGTLTVGGARLVAIEAAPGESANDT